MALPGKTKDLFLEPANPESLKVSVACHLKRSGNMFLQKPDPPTCNLTRKQYHTMLCRLSREGGVHCAVTKEKKRTEEKERKRKERERTEKKRKANERK
eukprot:1756005-Prorocentrum_lima.AAC.1